MLRMHIVCTPPGLAWGLARRCSRGWRGAAASLLQTDGQHQSTQSSTVCCCREPGAVARERALWVGSRSGWRFVGSKSMSG